MSPRYRQVEPTPRDDLGALGVGLLAGLGAAAVTFYLTRLLLAREPLSERALPGRDGTSATEE